MNRSWACLLVAIVVVPGCRRAMGEDAGRVDAGRMDAGRDAGRLDAGRFDAGPVDPGPALAALDYAATVVALVAGPLTPDADMLEGMGDTANDGTIQQRVENGVSGDSIVTDGACVMYAWTGRTATITFTGCVSETTGLTVDGVVTLSATIRPVAFTVTSTSLAIGGTTIDGSIALTVGGPAGARTFTVDADVMWTDGTIANHVTLTDVTVTTNATAMTTTLDGGFDLTVGTTSADGTMDAISWVMGDCHASSGSVTFSPTAPPTVIVTFLPTTPTNGTVSVQVPPFAAAEMDLLAACAP